MFKRPDDEDLFHTDDDKDDPDQMKLNPKKRERVAKLSPEEAPMPEGEMQHLEAAIGELGLSDRLTALVVNDNFATVAQLAKAIDENPTIPDLCVFTKWAADDAAEILKSVEIYRKKHRKAMVAAEETAA